MTDPFGLDALADPLPIDPLEGPIDAATVRVPGSKSITNRALVCAALADGTSTLDGALFADDTAAMLGVLDAVGIEVDADRAGERITVHGGNGRLPAASGEVDVRQSGTTARFALPMLALGEGSYQVTAHRQMQARPMDATFDALAALGAGLEPIGSAGRLPVVLWAGTLRSAVIPVPGHASSQFLSGLLLIGPCLPDGLILEVTSPLVSRPYVELTVAVMEAFGATVHRPDARTFAVDAGGYRGRQYRVEPDASAASYAFAAAAICGGRVRVPGLGVDALQGDTAFVDVLADLGCSVMCDADGTEVRAERDALSGGSFDLGDFSDTAQTLACVAPFAREPITIGGIGFIRRKETDRVAAVATELARCGVRVKADDDGWTIHPGTPQPATIQTYDDHRMAMSFALLGLRAPGIAIAGPSCVAKTFPGYWTTLASLRSDDGAPR